MMETSNCSPRSDAIITQGALLSVVHGTSKVLEAFSNKFPALVVDVLDSLDKQTVLVLIKADDLDWPCEGDLFAIRLFPVLVDGLKVLAISCRDQGPIALIATVDGVRGHLGLLPSLGALSTQDVCNLVELQVAFLSEAVDLTVLGVLLSHAMPT